MRDRTLNLNHNLNELEDVMDLAAIYYSDNNITIKDHALTTSFLFPRKTKEFLNVNNVILTKTHKKYFTSSKSSKELNETMKEMKIIKCFMMMKSPNYNQFSRTRYGVVKMASELGGFASSIFYTCLLLNTIFG